MSSKSHSGYSPLCPIKYIDGCRSKLKVDPYIEIKEDFDFGAALLLEYDILEQIFSYLPYKDLQNVAQLGESWANRIQMVIDKRLTPQLFSLSHFCYNAPNPMSAKPGLCLVFLQSDNRATSLKLQSYICVHEGITSEKRVTVIEFLENDLLTIKCPLAVLSCREVTTTYSDGNACHGVAFPAIPNVKMSVFRLRGSKEEISTHMNDSIGKENDVACLLTFALSASKKCVKNLISEIRHRQPTVNFAFGGGYILGMQAFNSNSHSKFYRRDEVLCIAFSKPKNTEVQFNAYSVILPENAISDTEIHRCLVEMKKHVVQRKYSVGIRITCISRYDQVLKEMELFEKHFPHTELLGFNGDGEIGWNCFTPEVVTITEEKSSKKRKLEVQKAFHELTTIIILLTWGVETKW